MRVLFALTALSLILIGCNGGEDFSDATVPGCPAGAPCDTSVRGEVLVELTGPRIENVGYKCKGTEVVFFTSEAEQSTTDTDGQSIIIPPFHALCPASSGEIEFFLGNALFEGNKVSLGSFIFPSQLQKENFQVTVADLILPPTRNSIDDAVLYRSALLQALDNDGDADDQVRIPKEDENNDGVDANEVIDDQPLLIPDHPFDGYADYQDFVNAWDPMISEINSQLQANSLPDVAGFDADTTAYEARISAAADRTRAGLYSIESAGECLLVDDCDFTADDGSRFALAINALILPTGKVLAGGQLVRSTADSESEVDYIGFQSTASLSDTLQLVNSDTQDLFVGVTGAGIGNPTPSNTDAEMQGRIFGQTLYTGVEINGNSDFALDYPTSDYVLADSEKGELAGELLGRTVPVPGDDTKNPVPIRGTKTGEVEIDLDPGVLANAVGDYRVTLMRACVGEVDDGDPDTCELIPNAMNEIGTNYPESITRGNTTVDIDSERARADENGTVDFCLTINADGIITTDGGSNCGTTHEVGMVTRTFTDSNSANIFIRMAPGLDVRGQTPHYNTEIQGRIDLGGTCKPLYRLSDDSFDNQIRAAWLDQVFLPAVQRAGWSDQENPSDTEQLVFASLQAGAVSFAEDGCTP